MTTFSCALTLRCDHLVEGHVEPRGKMQHTGVEITHRRLRTHARSSVRCRVRYLSVLRMRLRRMYRVPCLVMSHPLRSSATVSGFGACWNTLNSELVSARISRYSAAGGGGTLEVV